MSNQLPINCTRCGTPLDPNQLAGLCPRCLAAQHFATDTAAPDASARRQEPPPSPENIAASLPQLEAIEFLGRGGMGVVYKARQKSLGRTVALKLLAPERLGDADFAARFEREAKALAALNHPNIVTIYDFGKAGEFYYLLMEFVDGVNLRQAMSAGRFTPEQSLAIVPPVCEALQYAHEHGIVHRDIKPENLLLDKEGRVKIADFGIAKMLGTETSIADISESQPAGTPQYMAPEQKEHRVTDHRADIYSLGVVLYEMLTGELPADKLQPPSRKVLIDVRLDEIVLRAMEVKPELRFATASEFRTEVETLTREANLPHVPLAVAKSGSLMSSGFARAAAVVMSVLTIGIFAVLLIAQLRQPAGLRQLKFVPVSVDGTVVNVDIITEVGRGNVELYAELRGPKLPQELESEFVGGAILPAPHTRGEPWQSLDQGTRKSRLQFVLPTEELAKEAFQSLRSLSTTHNASIGQAFSGPLFEVRQPNGANYLAWLEVGKPFTADDPNWMNVYTTQFSAEELNCVLTYEVVASRPGTVSFAHDDQVRGFTQLQRRGGLYGVPARIELIKRDENHVQLVRNIGGSTSREDLTGRFRDLVEDLRRAEGRSVKTKRDTSIELCQIQGKPITILAEGTMPTSSTTTLFGEPGTWPAMAILLISGGVLTLLIVLLLRKDGSVLRRVAWGVGVMLILFGVVSFAIIARQANTVTHNASLGTEIESVEVTNEHAVVKARGSDDASMVFRFGDALNQWTPGGLYLDTMFDVSLSFGGLERGAQWNIKPRHGLQSRYKLDGVTGPMQGRIAFNPGTPTPEKDGSYVIAEFRPDQGEPLPIAVMVERDSNVPAKSNELATGHVGQAGDQPERSDEWTDAFLTLAKEVAEASGLPEEKPEELVSWGPEKDGMRAGLLIAGRVGYGQRLRTRLVFRNVSNETKDLKLTLTKYAIELSAHAEDDNSLSTTTPMLLGSNARIPVTLKAGKQIEMEGWTVQFGDNKQKSEESACLVETGFGKVLLNFKLQNLPLPDTGEATVVVEPIFNELPEIESKPQEPVHSMIGHSDWIKSLAFSPDGKRLASASRDTTIKLWEVETGKETLTLKRSADLNDGHTGYVEDVQFSPDGKYLASVGSSEQTTRIWNSESGRNIHTLTSGGGVGASELAFSPDGTRLATAGSTVRVFDMNLEADRGLPVIELDAGEPFSVAYSSDGSRLATVGRDRSLRVWNPVTSEELLHVKHKHELYSVSFSPDGKRLATASMQEIILWNADTGKVALKLQGATEHIHLAFSPNGLWLATAGWNKDVKLWNTQTGRQVRTLSGHGNNVWAIAFSPDGKRLATGGADRIVRIWNVDLLEANNKSALSFNVKGQQTLTFPLQHKLARNMESALQQLLQGRSGCAAKAAEDDESIIVFASPEVMYRIRTFITVNDATDTLAREEPHGYPQSTPLVAVRSLLHACAIEDTNEAITSLLSVGVLAELRGDTSKEYEAYQATGIADPKWEAELRGDWPEKHAALRKLVSEWNRHPLQAIYDSYEAVNTPHTSVATVFFDAPTDLSFVDVHANPKASEADRPADEASREPKFYVDSFPIWWPNPTSRRAMTAKEKMEKFQSQQDQKAPNP